MRDNMEDVTMLQALVNTTREKLVAAVLANTEFETLIYIKDKRIAELEGLLGDKASSNRSN